MSAALLLVAVSATAAQAISIEPLSTKFESASNPVKFAIGSGFEIVCNKVKLSGTTRSSKSSSVDVTPTLSECETKVPLVLTWKVESECKEAGTVPWTLTLTSGTNPFLGGIKLNCPLVFKLSGEKCLTMPVQSTTSGLEWMSFSEPIKSELHFNTSGMKSEATFFCEAQGLDGTTHGTVKGVTTIAGIDAK